jgi:hypothetical protein
MPAVMPTEKSALAAEVPDPDCRKTKDAPSCMDTPLASALGALPSLRRLTLHHSCQLKEAWGTRQGLAPVETQED